MHKLPTVLSLLLAFCAPACAQESTPTFLFVGSHHMNNHARDMFNIAAADVLEPAKQQEILGVVQALEAYRPTKIMIERDVVDQQEVQAQLRETCNGTRPPSREEYEQLGFRLACRLRIPVIAVNYNDLGPIQDAAKIDLSTADEEGWSRVKALGESDSRELQALERTQSIGELLRYLNSDAKTRETASRYFLLARLASPTERVGANWVQYWYGRNLTIFNNIVDNTDARDRVLVIYGYGHGYILRRMAEESGMFDVLDTVAFLKHDNDERANDD